MLKLLRHILTPQVSNNYRARILHPQLLAFFILIFFASGILMSFTRANFPSVLGISANVSTDELLILTNQRRQENGLPPLSLNSQLTSAAYNKANDMLSKNYWAHIAPDGTTPWYFIKNSGYSYIYAGENLARGYNSTSDVLNAWLASPTHRDNIMSSKYSNVGFAVVTGNLTGEDTVLVVEMFGNTGAPVGNKVAVQQAVQAISPTPVVTLQTTSPTPTLALVKEEVKEPVQEKATPSAIANALASNSQIKPLINAQTFSSNIAALTVTLFMFVLILDVVIIERKKILRFVGHNLDHVIFLGMILAIILFLLKGSVI
ncbi:MAG: hypothetical protein A3B38_03050 [Candidatus Levybacteria bacterium RIFCSPLOWO2_01_FULL_36_13]|nr:MAG: hypothetical protein A2684_04140 [Candidatus Levybacteria bacterium RIFCSPHIGHO2_01_FULL_36_15b]OGH35868.1 MAG: hypothetical protein A3B38_03050 [Candidatus Levybacteria bacterium RIFCSPLOWO2_01_FULL_36_13]